MGSTEKNKKDTSLQVPLNPTVIPDSQSIDAQKKYYYSPNTGASLLLTTAVNSGDEINTLPARMKKINNNNKYNLYSKGDDIYLSREQGSYVYTVQIQNFNNQFGKPRSRIGKIFYYIILKINEVSITNRKFNGRNEIYIPIDELVNIGIYKNRKCAMQSLPIVCTSLGGITMSIEKKKVGQKNLKQFITEPIFFHLSAVDKGSVRIVLNPNFSWSELCKYYSITPSYYFTLSKKSSMLLQSIFSHARIHVHNWVEKKYFTISFRAIQYEMGLPHESTIAKPARDIVNVILKAIDEISLSHHNAYHNSDLLLTPMPENITEKKTKEFLDSGYLKVELNGEYLDFFNSIHKKQRQKVSQNKKRMEKAKLNVLTAKLKNEESEEPPTANEK